MGKGLGIFGIISGIIVVLLGLFVIGVAMSMPIILAQGVLVFGALIVMLGVFVIYVSNRSIPKKQTFSKEEAEGNK